MGSRISWSSEQAVLAVKPHTPCGHHVHLSLLLRFQGLSTTAFANHNSVLTVENLISLYLIKGFFLFLNTS